MKQVILFLKQIFSDYLFIAHKLEQDKFEKYVCLFHGKIIDLGCGFRSHKRYFQNNQVVTLDSNEKANPDILGSVESIPAPSSSFDCAILTEVLEHVPHPEHALQETRRILKKKGLLYLTVPFHWGLHYLPHDYYRFTPPSLRNLLQENGFGIRICEPIGNVFSMAGMIAIDSLVQNLLFPIFAALNIKKGRYVFAAILFSPLSLSIYLLSKVLNEFDLNNPLGFMVIAESK